MKTINKPAILRTTTNLPPAGASVSLVSLIKSYKQDASAGGISNIDIN